MGTPKACSLTVSPSQSFLGGSGIVLGYFLSPQRRLRQKMILGLGFCDAVQGLVVMWVKTRCRAWCTL